MVSKKRGVWKMEKEGVNKEGYLYRLCDAIREYCIRYNIHGACFHCIKDCFADYSPWSGCMPYEEFCENYIQSEDV